MQLHDSACAHMKPEAGWVGGWTLLIKWMGMGHWPLAQRRWPEDNRLVCGRGKRSCGGSGMGLCKGPCTMSPPAQESQRLGKLAGTNAGCGKQAGLATGRPAGSVAAAKGARRLIGCCSEGARGRRCETGAAAVELRDLKGHRFTGGSGIGCSPGAGKTAHDWGSSMHASAQLARWVGRRPGR